MAKALDALACHDCELSLVFTTDEQIAALNSRYLKRSGPTNVIAFPMSDDPSRTVHAGMLGDIVISLERARQEARDLHLSPEERIDQLMIHGLLHLRGYDHERSHAAGLKMRKAEHRLLALIKEE